MRVALFSLSLSHGGVEVSTIRLANRMVYDARCERVIVITGPDPGLLIGNLNRSVHKRHLGSTNVLHAIIQLRRVLNEERVDVVFAAKEYENFVAAVAASFCAGVFAATSTRTIPSANNRSFTALRRARNYLLSSVSYRLAAANVCVSHAVKNDVGRYYRLCGARLQVIYNPVYDPSEVEAQLSTAGDSSSIAVSRPFIVAIGRLEPEKNYPLLLRAFRAALHSCDSTLLILGDGSMRVELQELVTQLKISEKVVFAGFVNDVYSVVHNAQLMVMTSHYEGFGNAIVEALAVGCPVLLGHVAGGAREVINSSEVGDVVDSSDPEEIGLAISNALSRSWDGDAIRARAADFSVQRAVEGYLSLAARIRR